MRSHWLQQNVTRLRSYGACLFVISIRFRSNWSLLARPTCCSRPQNLYRLWLDNGSIRRYNSAESFHCSVKNSQHSSFGHTMVLTHLDYGSATLTCQKKSLLDRIQSALHAETRLTYWLLLMTYTFNPVKMARFPSICKMLIELNWLPR
jgi:hypothetical protein